MRLNLRALARLPVARLSAFLISHQEEERLGCCLASLSGLADEIVVLDDGSTDATVAIARAAGARVEHRHFDGFGRQKQAAMDLAQGDWLLSIDADEVVTPELARELRQVVERDGPHDGYWIRRRLTYLGARLRFGGTGSDWVLRMVRRSRARFIPRTVHERLVVEGSTGRLGGVLEHHSHRTLAEHLATIDRYTDLAGAEKLACGNSFRAWHVLRIPFELFNRLVLRLGLLDGRAGVIHAGMASFYAFLKYAKMWRAGEKR